MAHESNGQDVRSLIILLFLSSVEIVYSYSGSNFTIYFSLSRDYSCIFSTSFSDELNLVRP